MATDPRGSESRLFPAVSESLYEDTPRLRAAVRPTRLRDAFSIKKPDADRRFARIVTAHATAFEAERAGQWGRADFYWSELWSLIANAADDDSCWAAGATAGEGTGLSPSAFRRHFLREIVADCHAAFFRSQVEAGLSPLERPSIHLEGIARVHDALPDTDIEDEARLSDALAAVALAHQHLTDTGFEDVLFLFAERFPKQTQYVRAGLARLHARTMTQLEQSKGITRRIVVDAAIERVTDIRRQFPLERACYQVLGVLHHEHTIVLAEAGDISGALLASRKAEAFGADQAVVTNTQNQLTQIMAVMQSQAKQVEETLRTSGGELTDKGRELIAQAAAGGTAAAAWSLSGEAKEIRSALERARVTPVRVSAVGEMQLPSIALQSTTKSRGQERLSDMLASANARRLRLQIVAAVLCVAFAAGSLAREAWVVRQHDRALEKVNQARAANDDDATLQALGELFTATAPHGDETRAALAPLYGETLARWLTTKIGALSPDDRRVLERYNEQVVDRGLDAMEVQP